MLTASLSVTAAPAAGASGLAAAAPPTTGQCRPETGFACYGVDQICGAYNVDRLIRHRVDGRGQTIAMFVSPFHLPNLIHDVAVFSAAYGLPSADVEFYSFGPNPEPDPTNSFDTFLALDGTSAVEWAHAMAPGARLLVVETGPAISDPVMHLQMLDGQIRYLLDDHMADVLSLGDGDGEAAQGRIILDNRGWLEQAAQQHVPVISIAGEIGRLSLADPASGPDAWWPADDPLATSVGTAELTLDASGDRTAPDRVWNDSQRVALPLAGGGGLSQFFDRPSYQHRVRSVVGDRRGVPDLAMAGGCDGRLVAYSSYDTFDFYVSNQPESASWQPFCSSSQSAALFARIVADAQRAAGRDLGPLNPKLYQAADVFIDVTVGDNAVSATDFSPADPGDPASPGYDLVTGLGSPDAYKLVRDLAQDN